MHRLENEDVLAQDVLDDTQSAVDEAALLVDIPGESNPHTCHEAESTSSCGRIPGYAVLAQSGYGRAELDSQARGVVLLGRGVGHCQEGEALPRLSLQSKCGCRRNVRVRRNAPRSKELGEL